MTKTFVSVIIPTKTLTDYLVNENLPALNEQTYPSFEAIVLPNKSSSLDKQLLQKYAWLRIITTEKITRPTEKRDIGAKQAKGEIIAFIDDDAYPTPEWMENAVKIFEKNKIAAVCGPGILPAKTNLIEKVCDTVFRSWVGSGGYAYRFTPQKERYVDDYPSMNFLIKKVVFNKLGGFNNDYWPGEDSKLCEDLVYKEKEKILYDPSVIVYHHRRTNLLSYLKQHANYGFHRGAFFSHGDRNSRRLSYLIPSLFVLYLISLPLTLFYLPLLIYSLGVVYLFLTSLASTKNFIIALLVPFILISTHITYGLMFIKGFFVGIIKKEKIYA